MTPDRSGRTGPVAWDTYGFGPGVPLVLLHGWSDSGECWSPSLPAWTGGRSVLTIDARGHGRSTLPREPFTVAAMAADAAAVLRAVLDRPAVVVGHSMGGLVAEELALSEPELVAALVLEDPAWRVPRESTDQGVPLVLRDGLLALGDLGEAEVLAAGRAENPAWPTDELGPWARSKVQLDRSVLDLPHQWDGRDWLAALNGLRMPVTLLTGESGRGAIVDEGQVALAEAALGDLLRRVHLPTGHCVRREARTAVEAAVRDALTAADLG